MDACWEAVKAFHEAFGAPAADRPVLLAPERVGYRVAWLREEVDELTEAQTIAEQADAVIDLIYFALGTLVEMGVRPQELFEIVHTANMQKLWPDGKVRTRSDDGKILKPPGWQAPEPLLEAAIHKQLLNDNDCSPD